MIYNMVLRKRCKAVERYMLVITGLAAVAFMFSYMGYAPVFSVLPTKKGTGGLNDDENWNLFYHLGGNGPWIPKIDDVVPGGVDVPVGCSIDQAHMISRHAERYPTHTAGERRSPPRSQSRDHGLIPYLRSSRTAEPVQEFVYTPAGVT